jgi:hypothetical protein
MTHTVEFSVHDASQDPEEKYGRLIEAILDQFVPAVSQISGTSADELSARLFVELAFQIGATHSAKSALALLSAAHEAAMAGQDQSDDVGETGIESDGDLRLSELECSPVRH